jgi:hypothetical protein
MKSSPVLVDRNQASHVLLGPEGHHARTPRDFNTHLTVFSTECISRISHFGGGQKGHKMPLKNTFSRYHRNFSDERLPQSVQSCSLKSQHFTNYQGGQKQPETVRLLAEQVLDPGEDPVDVELGLLVLQHKQRDQDHGDKDRAKDQLSGHTGHEALATVG